LRVGRDEPHSTLTQPSFNSLEMLFNDRTVGEQRVD